MEVFGIFEQMSHAQKELHALRNNDFSLRSRYDVFLGASSLEERTRRMKPQRLLEHLVQVGQAARQRFVIDGLAGILEIIDRGVNFFLK